MNLQRQGIEMNLKTLRRLYGEEKLQVRKRALGTRRPMLVPDHAYQRWSLDFVSDSFADGRRFRGLTVVDDHTRECIALVVDTSLSGPRVARELDAVIAHRGPPLTVVSDNFCDIRSASTSLGARRHIGADVRPMGDLSPNSVATCTLKH